MRTVEEVVRASIQVKEALLGDRALVVRIQQVADAMIAAYRADHKVMFCGNGGSAADAQHIAAELSGRFYFDRPPLYAEALHANSSFMTAVANDYSYAEVFARAVRGTMKPGDILFVISTSGKSPIVVRAAQAAAQMGISTVAMTGETGGDLKTICTHLLNVPSRDPARIQESHILIGHILCEFVEESLFGSLRTR